MLIIVNNWEKQFDLLHKRSAQIQVKKFCFGKVNKWKPRKPKDHEDENSIFKIN